HRDIVGAGRLAEIDELGNELERRAVWEPIYQRMADEYLDGTVERWVREIAPTIVLADIVKVSPIQYVAHRLRIPCVQLSTHLSQRIDELPPFMTDLSLEANPLELETARWQTRCVRLTTP